MTTTQITAVITAAALSLLVEGLEYLDLGNGTMLVVKEDQSVWLAAANGEVDMDKITYIEVVVPAPVAVTLPTQYELGRAASIAGKAMPVGASDFYELGWWSAK